MTDAISRKNYLIDKKMVEEHKKIEEETGKRVKQKIIINTALLVFFSALSGSLLTIFYMCKFGQ